MAFSPIFQRPFSATFDRRAAAAAAVPWWLAGGVAAANAIAVYQPKGAASLAASYVNLANPGTYDAAPGVAPTFDAATGWTFNGSNQYLTTGVVPASGWSLIVRFANISTTNRYQIATFSSQHFGFGSFFGNGTTCYYRNNTSALVAPELKAGTLAIAGATAYRNGIDEGITLAPQLSVVVPAFFIGCRNTNGTPQAFSDGDFQAVAIYNTTLTAPQVLAVSTAMAAL